MCSYLCKVQRLAQALTRAKIKLCSFPVLQKFSLSCPALTSIRWPMDKGMRFRDYITCCVGRRCDQLRGYWTQMQSGSKYLRNGPVLSLNTESAISQLQVRFFLQSLLQALFLLISPSILLMTPGLISISGS